MENYVGHVFVLTNANQPEQWKGIQRKWKNTFSFHPIETENEIDKNRSRMLSHAKIIRWAHNLQLPYVTVWENDMLPYEDPLQVFKRWCRFEKEVLHRCSAWSVISGGTSSALQATYTRKIQHTYSSERILQVNSGHCTPWICYRASTYKPLLQLIYDQNKDLGRYDVFLYRTFQPWVLLPFLATSQKRETSTSIQRTLLNYRFRYFFHWKTVALPVPSFSLNRPCNCSLTATDNKQSPQKQVTELGP